MVTRAWLSKGSETSRQRESREAKREVDVSLRTLTMKFKIPPKQNRLAHDTPGFRIKGVIVIKNYVLLCMYKCALRWVS